jgi:hypothetical protein
MHGRRGYRYLIEKEKKRRHTRCPAANIKLNWNILGKKRLRRLPPQHECAGKAALAIATYVENGKATHMKEGLSIIAMP